MSLTGVCEHMKVLEPAGLVRRTRLCRDNTLELNPEPLQEIPSWVLKYEPFWTACLDRLEAFFAHDKEKSS